MADVRIIMNTLNYIIDFRINRKFIMELLHLDLGLDLLKIQDLIYFLQKLLASTIFFEVPLEEINIIKSPSSEK